MNYTLNQLRIFLKIVQTESITKASEELHLTQPAVSIQLKNFQQQFEIPLTEVIGKKLFITDFGREIAQAADSILNEVYAINYKAMAYKGHLTGRLKISVVSTGKYVIPYFLSAFLKKNPNIELQLDFSNKAKVIENLEKNEVDFSLVSILPESLRLKHTKLMQNKLFLVGNLEQKFGDKTIDKSVLEGMTLIYREEGSATRAAMEKFIVNSNVTSKSKLEITTNEAIKQSVIAGLGFSIMPLIGMRNELTNQQLQIIPAKGLPICTDWNLVWLADKKLSPVSNAFLEYIEKEKISIINEHFSWYETY